MAKKMSIGRSSGAAAVQEPEPPQPLPEMVPAVTLVREGSEGWRVVIMQLPYDVVIQHSVHLHEPDVREMNEAQILNVFQRWREEGQL